MSGFWKLCKIFAPAANVCKPPILWKNNVLLVQKVSIE